jgi:hypothetical protein
MSDVAQEIFVAGAAALARADGPGPSLQILLGSIADQLDVGSAAIFTIDKPSGRLRIVASIGLEEGAIAGLAAAVARPGHPIARTIAAPVPSFNVLPTAPGGPALRSHLPLIVTRGGTDTVLGVMALAHDRPLDPDTWPLFQACANLAAVGIEGQSAG